MPILDKPYANFIAIALLCCLMTINKTAWGQIYDMEYPDHSPSGCGVGIGKVFVLPPALPLKQRIDSSSFVFEGRIVSTKTLEHNNRHYTCATIAVKKIFKGDFVSDTVEVLSYYGLNPNDKRPQYIEDISKYDAKSIFFVNQNNVFNTSLQSGRLRFRLAFVNGSITNWWEIAGKMGLCGNLVENCLDDAVPDRVRDAIKKVTKKCVDVAQSTKKKQK